MFVRMVPENGFLYEKDIAAGFLHLLDNVEDVLTFIAQHAVHLSVVRDNHLVVHLSINMHQCHTSHCNAQHRNNDMMS